MISCFSAPVLTATPAKSGYEEGSNVTLTCSYVAPNDVKWYRYFFNGPYILIGHEVQLIKSNLDPWDSGDYTCEAVLKSMDKTPRSNIVTIHVPSKLTIIIPLSPRQKYPFPKCTDKRDRSRTNNMSSSREEIWNIVACQSCCFCYIKLYRCNPGAVSHRF